MQNHGVKAQQLLLLLNRNFVLQRLVFLLEIILFNGRILGGELVQLVTQDLE